MQRAKVIGKTTATVKHPALVGWRMMIVQPLLADDGADGPPLIAVDELGARIGDNVMLTTDGSAVRDIMKTKTTPVRYAIIGLEDEN